MDKLITFTVPCYNSAAYMDHCIETLLTAGEEAEIILVDDGSKKDNTPGEMRRMGGKIYHHHPCRSSGKRRPRRGREHRHPQCCGHLFQGGGLR